MIKRKEQWIALGKQMRKQFFFYEDKVLDLTHFMGEHPGGKKALANYAYKDITDTIFSVYPHKRQPTLRVLQSFIIGKIPSIDVKSPRLERSVTPNKEKEKKKVCFAKKVQPGLNQTQQQKQQAPMPPVSAKQNNSLSESSSKKKKEKSKSKPKSKEKQSSQKNIKGRQQYKPVSQTSMTALLEDMDEQKPQFRVPVFCIKHMNQIA